MEVRHFNTLLSMFSEQPSCYFGRAAQCFGDLLSLSLSTSSK